MSLTREAMDILADCTFERVQPGMFLKCESAVFMAGSNNSLCYTTSTERADVLVAILNEWVELRRKANDELKD